MEPKSECIENVFYMCSIITFYIQENCARSNQWVSSWNSITPSKIMNQQLTRWYMLRLILPKDYRLACIKKYFHTIATCKIKLINIVLLCGIDYWKRNWNVAERCWKWDELFSPIVPWSCLWIVKHVWCGALWIRCAYVNFVTIQQSKIIRHGNYNRTTNVFQIWRRIFLKINQPWKGATMSRQQQLRVLL